MCARTLNLSLDGIKNLSRKCCVYLRMPYSNYLLMANALCLSVDFKCCTEGSLFYDLHGIYLILPFTSIKCSAVWFGVGNFHLSSILIINVIIEIFLRMKVRVAPAERERKCVQRVISDIFGHAFEGVTFHLQHFL